MPRCMGYLLELLRPWPFLIWIVAYWKEKSTAFGPYAAWTTKFLHRGGSFFDLPGSIKLHNWLTLVKVGISNLPLVGYLIQQGLQSMDTRLKELRNFYPDAKAEDWKLIDAGIRVQAIKKEDGDAGIVHFGTEVVTSEDCSIAALLGASPGNSVCVNIVLEVAHKCFTGLFDQEQVREKLLDMIPTFGKSFQKPGGRRICPNLLSGVTLRNPF